MSFDLALVARELREAGMEVEDGTATEVQAKQTVDNGWGIITGYTVMVMADGRLFAMRETLCDRPVEKVRVHGAGLERKGRSTETVSIGGEVNSVVQVLAALRELKGNERGHGGGIRKGVYGPDVAVPVAVRST